MPQRDANRIREHSSQPEHFLSKVTDIEILNSAREGQSLCHCKCSWMGWIDNEELQKNGIT